MSVDFERLSMGYQTHIVSTQMLVFRKGVWLSVEIVLSDPLFSEGNRMEAASIAATAMEKGLSVQAATAEAERILYGRLFPGLTYSHVGFRT